MIIPVEFQKFMDGIRDMPTYEELDSGAWIGEAFRRLDGDERFVVRGFLKDFLAQNPTDKEMERLWNENSRAFYVIAKGGLRPFYEKLLSEAVR